MSTNKEAWKKIDVSGMTARQVTELALELGKPIHFEAQPRKEWNGAIQVIMQRDDETYEKYYGLEIHNLFGGA